MRTYGTLTWGEQDGRAMWEVEAEPHVTLRLKRVFGRVQAKRTGAVWMADTPETSADLEWFMSRYPLDVDEVAADRLRSQAAGHRQTQDTAERILAGHRLRFERQPAREPRCYQLEAADLCLETGRLLLCDGLGLGKTFTGYLLLRHPESLPAVVVCLAHLPAQWLAELHVSFPELKGHIVRSRQPYPVDADVLVVTYSKLAGWQNHLAGVARTVIFDEMQDLRRDGTDKYCAAGQVADRARFKMGLTGTPVYNYGGEVFNLIEILAPGALGTRPEFTREWGAEIGNDRVRVREPRALGSHLRDERLLLTRDWTDVGIEIGPEPVTVPHVVDADDGIIEEGADSAVSFAQLVLRRDGTQRERWHAASEIDWRMRRATGLAKAPFVAGFVRMLLETEPKVLLLGWHRDVYDAWAAGFRSHLIDFEMYSGSESPAQKNRAASRFITDPDCRVLMMSLRSGAGLDGLQEACRVAVFGELDWSPGIHKQCIGRLFRGGQTSQVVAYFLYCETGSDPAVMEALGVKRGQAEPIRRPSAPLLETVDTTDRVRTLAEAVVAQARRRKGRR